MFSVIFPGQGSQLVGMGKDLYSKYKIVQDLFKEADDTLGFSMSNLILNGPKEDLDLTENTQPAIFLISCSIFNLIKKEFNINLNKANFFAGHSLGEYSALASAGVLTFSETLKILKIRGKAMQNSVPKGVGGMVAVLGSQIEIIEKFINENSNKYQCYIANDNSVGQIVLSGNLEDLEKMMNDLKAANIKCIKLPVSAPFHCELINSAANRLKSEVKNYNFKDFKFPLVSNVNALPCNSKSIQNLLVDQVVSRVRWREILIYMVCRNINTFIEIGPGNVLTNLVKRMSKSLTAISISKTEDLIKLKEIL